MAPLYHVQARDPWFLRFHDLMAFRIREILLVSPAYDAFILEEDGRLTERLYSEYSELDLSLAPRITHVSTAARALQALESRRFDMIITVVRLKDMPVAEFAFKVKQQFDDMPVLLLTFDQADMEQCPGGVCPIGIDRMLLWTGDARILMAGIKLIEDVRNAERDTRIAGLQVIIVVEDSVQRYSSFLTLLYTELMRQSGSLIAEGLNDLHRRMRMAARPKILLATTWEEAIAHYERYKDYLFALISDVRFPREGVEMAGAGFELVEALRANEADLPILLQSAEKENAARAEELNCVYADKNSPDLLARIRSFMTRNLGFGDFVFRLPDGTKVGRAADVYEMEKQLAFVPAESIEYHAGFNHFSIWLKARCMFPLAAQIRPRTNAEFVDIQHLREYLMRSLRDARLQEQAGMIADFSSRQSGSRNAILRLGKGSIGGKGRAIAFANSQIIRSGLSDRHPGMEIRVPRTVVIGTGEFDNFLAEDPPPDELLHGGSDEEIRAVFLKRPLAEAFARDLRQVFSELSGPLAVRSSSLLEDSRLQPFAGIYATWIIPNSHADPEVRFRELCRAIKAVYASCFSEDARAYFRGTLYSIEQEKMGVVIQEMVGQQYGNRFYPHFAGVAQSYNFYPVGIQVAEQGIAQVALGLGHYVVSGGSTLRFSPGCPEVLPQFPTAAHFAKGSQNDFLAIDLSVTELDFLDDCESNLIRHGLDAAERDGSLQPVGSVYFPHDDMIRDGLNWPGPRVVTFSNILKWEALPLADALTDLLKLAQTGMGGDIEIEFAVDMGDWGRTVLDDTPRKPSLCVLQVRPMMLQDYADASIDTESHASDQVLCRTDIAIGHGMISDVRDVVYVTTAEVDGFVTPKIALEVAAVNERLMDEGRPYLLIGPGRWGTFDSALGVPVKWGQIAGARVIVEAPFGDRNVDPSQGTHFFQNLTSLRLGYLTMRGRAPAEREFLDREWLGAQEAFEESVHIRHVRLERPLAVHLDGRKGKAVILKPAAPDDLEPA